MIVKDGAWKDVSVAWKDVNVAWHYCAAAAAAAGS